jgi:hypothetical protein
MLKYALGVFLISVIQPLGAFTYFNPPESNGWSVCTPEGYKEYLKNCPQKARKVQPRLPVIEKKPYDEIIFNANPYEPTPFEGEQEDYEGEFPVITDPSVSDRNCIFCEANHTGEAELLPDPSGLYPNPIDPRLTIPFMCHP